MVSVQKTALLRSMQPLPGPAEGAIPVLHQPDCCITLLYELCLKTTSSTQHSCTHVMSEAWLPLGLSSQSKPQPL